MIMGCSASIAYSFNKYFTSSYAPREKMDNFVFITSSYSFYLYPK